MKPIVRESKRLGIIGGGQLARMLAQSASPLGHIPFCLAESSSDPAAQLCRESLYGKASDPAVLERFLSQADVVAFENEFVDCSALERALNSVQARGHSVAFLPSTEVIRRLQDKLRQKEILEELGIPSAEYVPLEDPTEDSIYTHFPAGAVLKWARLGYDGKGTFFLRPENRGRNQPALRAFISEARRKKVPLFAEKKVEFLRELALIGCLSISGEFRAYPLVISEQERGICRWTLAPASHHGVSQELEQRATEYARKIASHLKLYGCFGVECFETSEGELLVNELAPRVHNTGHYTQNATCTSQFENHWRALLGLPLGSTELNETVIMRNLLGEIPDERQLDSRMHLHWYGKSELRPGRKMGHINGILNLKADEAEVSNLKSAMNRVGRT